MSPRLFGLMAVAVFGLLAFVASGGAPAAKLSEKNRLGGQAALTLAEKHRFARPRSVVGLMFSPDGKELCEEEYTGQKLETTFVAFNLVNSEQRRENPPARFLEFVANRKAPVKLENTVLINFLPDGKHYLTGGGNLKSGFAVQLRDAKDGAVLREFHRHRPAFGFYALSPNGNRLASAESGARIHVSDVETGKDVAELKDGHGKAIAAIAFHPTQAQVATIGEDFVRVWDLPTAKAVRKLEFATRAQGVAYSPNGKWLAVATDIASGKSPEIIFLDASTFEKVASVKRERECGAVGIVFNPTGTLIAAGPRGNLIQVWEISEKCERPSPAKKDSPK